MKETEQLKKLMESVEITEAGEAAAVLDKAIQIAQTKLNITGKFKKVRNVARAQIPAASLGEMARVLSKVEYVITATVDRYAQREGKNIITVTIGMHWYVKGWDNKVTKGLHSFKYYPEKDKWVNG